MSDFFNSIMDKIFISGNLLHPLDWTAIGIYFVIILCVGLYFVKRGGKNTTSYFLAGRSLPWWIAGTSIVATMFAADTPLFHTGNVRRFGLDAGWLFFLPGFGVVLASVLFARLWRRARVMTEIELLEMRYSGRAAKIFRGANAVYGGVFQAALTMGWVTLAMGVLVETLLGIDKVIGTWFFLGIVLIYSVSAGLWGVVATNFIQYMIATFGTIFLAVVSVVKCGGLAAMNEKLAAVPDWSGSAMRVFPEPSAWGPMFGWWIIIGYLFVFGIQTSVSGGFMGQAVYASKDEKNASHALLWFGFCYYVLNGWPWIITGLASVILLGATNEAAGLGDYQDTYPAMIVKLMPIGMRGIMAAAMIAAFMSTISTLLNWGSSYMVNDFYRRFLVKGKSERYYVLISRLFSVGLAVFGGWFAFQFDTLTSILLRVPLYLIGIVLVWVFRWLWSRTNIWSEISAMVGSIFMAILVDIVFAKFGIWQSPIDPVTGKAEDWIYFGQKILTILGGTTAIWLIVTMLTKPVDDEILKKFYKLVVIPGPGWNRIRKLCGDDCPKADSGWRVLFTYISGCVGLFGLLLAIGYAITCKWSLAAVIFVVSVIGSVMYFKLFNTLTHLDDDERGEQLKASLESSQV